MFAVVQCGSTHLTSACITARTVLPWANAGGPSVRRAPTSATHPAAHAFRNLPHGRLLFAREASRRRHAGPRTVTNRGCEGTGRPRGHCQPQPRRRQGASGRRPATRAARPGPLDPTRRADEESPPGGSPMHEALHRRRRDRIQHVRPDADRVSTTSRSSGARRPRTGRRASRSPSSSGGGWRPSAGSAWREASAPPRRRRGPPSGRCWEGFRDEILADLRRAMPVDGVLLNLHGAMVADGYDDCEGDILARVRPDRGSERCRSARSSTRTATSRR